MQSKKPLCQSNIPKYLLLASTLFICGTAYGAAKVIKESNSEWVAEASSSYVLGDNDTRIDARNIALNEAKRAASEIVGTRVRTDLVIENDQILKDQITVITSAFMKVEVLKENMTVSKDKRSVMEITIRAHLDKSAIKDRIDSYKGDEKRQQAMTNVQAENARLQKELSALNAELALVRSGANDGIIAQKPRSELIAQRDTLMSALEESQGQIRRVFEKGSLLQMALKGSDEASVASATLEKRFFGYIKSNTKVTVGTPEFRDNGNGTYDVLVSLQWKANSALAVKAIQDYFELDFNNGNSFGSDKTSRLVVYGIRNTHSRQKKPYTEKLYQQINGSRVSIRVSLGGKLADLTIGSGLDCFVSCGGFGTSEFQWMPSGSAQSSLVSGEQNPVIIRSVPAELLKEQTAINAEVVVTKL